MGESTSTRNALQDLPQDCWVQILDQISPSDTASVVATSRDLQVSSESSLYRHVKIDWIKPPLKRVLSLLKVIHERPDLASQIHHVSMIPSKLEYPAEMQIQKWNPPQIDGDWNQLSSLFEKEVNVAKDIVTKAQFPSLAKWICALEKGDPYAFVAVILSQLHNLKSLELDYTFVWQSGFPGLMVRHALLSAPEGSLSRFAELSIVEYGMNVPQSREFHELGAKFIDAFPPCDSEQFAGWFYLPALKSLEIWLQSLEGVKDELSKPAGSSKLKSLPQLQRLVLAECPIEEGEARDLLLHLSSLKSLHLGLVYPSQDRELGWSEASARPPLKEPGVLIEGLMSVKDTLEDLSVGMELCPLYYPSVWSSHNRDNRTPEENFKQCIGILKQFQRLKSAEVPSVMLLGWTIDDAPPISEVLPPTLQKLAIRDQLIHSEDFELEDEIVTEAVQDYLPSAKSTTPLLDTIMFRSFSMGKGREWNEDNAKELRNLSAELGLDIDISSVISNVSPGLWTVHREFHEASHKDCRYMKR
ncbi:uncharacterized protein N7511_002727 [Penicillium nucicola]|uniref:uncharacterized protein n=1 Tax=Penicillium nucicola TaxID=1850975 RepID=UPI0025457AAE|nr:uncharacterized protein N7511_002727 [Penicillium nucicola]KAJ5770676.1 hypothetical protein N7511_002727 [Penicillium nucicola]